MKVSRGSDSRPLVAHVLYRLDVGGLENGLVNLLNTLPTDRLRHAVITLAGHSDFRQRIQRRDVEVLSLDKRPGKDPTAYLRFHRLLRQLKPDVVHTRNLGTVDMQWVARVAGVPVRIHGEHGRDAADIDGLDAANLRIRRLCSPAIHHYVTMSKDLERWLNSVVGIEPRRITQIYNGVDATRFADEGPLPADLPWKGEPDIIAIGTVGRLERTKNQVALIRAFAHLQRLCRTQAPMLRLLIAGAGPDRAELQRQVESLGLSSQTWFAGVRHDVPEVMRALDVFVLPSLNEGISNTILESMATGRPTVAGDVGGNPELVQPGVTGSLFDVARPDDLADRLAQYVATPGLAARHGAAARQRAVDHFSLERMTARYLELYVNQVRDRR